LIPDLGFQENSLFNCLVKKRLAWVKI